MRTRIHSSLNLIYAYQCYFCNKQYVTISSLRIRVNGHRYAIEGKYLRSSLFTHLQLHTDDLSIPDYHRQDWQVSPVYGINHGNNPVSPDTAEIHSAMGQSYRLSVSGYILGIQDNSPLGQFSSG